MAYFHRGNPQVEKWITLPAIKAETNSLVQLVKASDDVGFRSLHHSSGPLAILTNWGRDDEVEVRFRGEYATVKDLLGNLPAKVAKRDQSTYAVLTLPAGKVCALKASA